MRGRSSSAKARLRSAGYKCNLCSRRLIDAATLERHQKAIHNVTLRGTKMSYKPKPVQKKPMVRDKEKIFSNLRKEHVLEQSKLNLKKKNSENVSDTKELAVESKIVNKNIEVIESKPNDVKSDIVKTKNGKDPSKQITFECPECGKSYTAYFNAQKHIEKAHSKENEEKKLIPVCVEPCIRCANMTRSDAEHICPTVIEEHITELAEFVCSGCNQVFPSLKSFDMHVAGLHSDAVDSMFFPSKLEFMTWRLEMERETTSKYSLYGEYESKKVYRCNFARNDGIQEKYTVYFCPSSMVVQEFSKGIQVHYYKKHFDHESQPYTLTNKYKKYSITSFLRNPKEESVDTASTDKLDDKELYSQFKKLMESIITNANEVKMSVLKNLIEKALDMSTLVAEAAPENVLTKARRFERIKIMTDSQIMEAIESKTDPPKEKRRKSVDSCETPKPAKRMRNISLINQSPAKLSPKIVNTYSLASKSSDDFKSEDDDNDFDSIKSENSDKTISKATESEKAPKVTKMTTRLASFNESLSFNDSYKDFIDKNFTGKETKSRNTVKTRLGAFKQTSPRKGDKDETDTPVINVINRGLKPIVPKSKTDDAKSKTTNTDTSKVNIISIETPSVTITKLSSVKSDNNQKTNNELNESKETKANVLKKKLFSLIPDAKMKHTIDNRDSSSPVEVKNTLEWKMSNAKSRNVISPVTHKKINNIGDSSPLKDPLEVTYVVDTGLNSKQPLKNTTRVYSGPVPAKTTSPAIKTTKVTPITPKVTPNTSKVTPNTSKVVPNTTKVVPNTPKVVPNTPKVAVNTPKVIFEDKASSSSAKFTPQKIKDIEYEVRERENDCNILVLKF